MNARWLVPALLLVSLPAWAEPLRLGDVTLTDAPDRDVVRLPACEGPENTPITRLKLRVTEHAAEIDRLVVEFGNGGTQELEVRAHFDIGEESRWIEMRGPARCVRKIKVVGDADTIRRTPNKTAQVAFWGEAIEGESADAPPPPAGAGKDRPEEIGDRELLGRLQLTDQLDRDVVDLPACPTGGNHPVTQIAMRVSEHPAQLQRIKVVFENGDEVVVDLNKTFGVGEHTDWKDLPGEARCIDKIVVVGDAQSVGFRPGKQATVSFFGR